MKRFLLSLSLILILPAVLLFGGCEAKIKGLKLTLDEVVREYIVGDDVQVYGLVVELRFSNGRTEEIYEYEVDTSEVDINTPGEYKIYVTFENYSSFYTVNYYKKGTMSVIANNIYYVGQSFASAYPTIRLTSGDGKVSLIGDAYTVVSFDNTSVGDDKVAVINYKGKDYECKVKVVSKEDYYNYVVEKFKSSTARVNISSVSFTKNDNEFYYISAYQGIGAYSKVNDDETWILRADVFEKRDGSVTESQYGDYEQALRNVFKLQDSFITIPIEGTYSSLTDAVSQFKKDHLNGKEYSIEYSTQYSYLTITLAADDGTKLSFSIDLRDYTLRSFEYELSGETFSIRINPTFTIPPMEE